MCGSVVVHHRLVSITSSSHAPSVKDFENSSYAEENDIIAGNVGPGTFTTAGDVVQGTFTNSWRCSTGYLR